MASAGGERLSRDEMRKKRDIEDARKAGTLPPEQDEDGNMINPHNPDYISKRPWYLGESGPSLKHQNAAKKETIMSMQEQDDLMHRHGRAAVTAGNLGKLAYDAKRDPWAGYDPSEHQMTIRRHEKMEQERQNAKIRRRDRKAMSASRSSSATSSAAAAAIAKIGGGGGGGGGSSGGSGGGGAGGGASAKAGGAGKASDSDSDYESDDESDEDQEFRDKTEKLFHGRVARQGGVGGAQMATTVRNLRIREDTAKYLRNLDPNSAYYDPKTRSMRDNPLPHERPEDVQFAGDNYVRHSGDVQKLASTQLFAWDAASRGSDIHPQANPSQAELAQKQFRERKEKLKSSRKGDILAKYGSEKYMQPQDKSLLLGQAEGYVEYSRDGRLLNGGERATAKSKYVEDVMDNNHTAVWGSYFDKSTFRWGYADDHSTQYNSWSTGEAGKLASQSATAEMMERAVERAMLPARGAEAADGKAERPGAHNNVYGEAEQGKIYDAKKLKAALEKEEEFQRQKPDEQGGKGKRRYNSMASTNVTEEEMEAYRMKKARSNADPMAKLLGSEDLLPLNE